MLQVKPTPLHCLLSLLSLLFFIIPGKSQVQVNLGAATLYGQQAYGATATLYHPSSSTSFSVGYDGRLLLGARENFSFGRWDMSAGTQTFTFLSEQIGQGFSCVCISARRPPNAKTRIQAFAGLTGAGYFLPFVFGFSNQPLRLGAGLIVDHDLNKHIRISTLDAISGSLVTAIGGAEYHIDRKFQANVSAGLFNGARFWQGSGEFTIDGASIFAFHQSYLFPYVSTNNSIGMAWSHDLGLASVSLSGSVNDGTFAGIHTRGENAGAGLRISFLNIQSNYFRTEHQQFLFHSIQERLNRHFMISQNITQARQSSVGFGGGYSSNRVSISLTRQISYILTGKYVQSTAISVSFVLRDIQIQAQTVSDPFSGKTRYLVTSQSFWGTPSGQVGPYPVHRRFKLGKLLYFGSCLTQDQKPMQCSVDLGRAGVAISNSEGLFEIHSDKKANGIKVEVINPGNWRVRVSEPKEDQPIRISVERT